RDGVLNRAEVRDGRPYPPALADAELLPLVGQACLALKEAGFLLIVVTNQPDIARGTLDQAASRAVDDWLREQLPIDDIRVCPHDDSDNCRCRKPRPGLLTDAAREWSVSLPLSTMVGDRWRDVEAGRQAGCSTVFVDRHYAERRPDEPDLVVAELAEAVPWIVERWDEEVGAGEATA
ncbi:MAG TPA: HAD-IIIA family hydrolase, partial [Acidimicrobiales bacterium]|nr:HAD-IIIA family hydrolase [Acidimicrobiales bacterium]